MSNLPFPGSLFGKLTVKLVLILLPNKQNQITTCTLEIANSPLERAEVHNWSAIANLKKHTHRLREAAERAQQGRSQLWKTWPVRKPWKAGIAR